MTRPMGEPNAGKRIGSIQKATRQLQRRPAPDVSQTGIFPGTAIGQATLRSQTCTGNLAIEFDFVYWNDSTIYGYDGVSGGRAKYITISREGTYLADFTIFWDTDWTVGDFPYIEPSDLVLGSAGALITDVDVAWDVTQNIIYGEQFTAAEMDHHSLSARNVFNFDATYFGTSTIGVGMNMRSSSTRTKNFGGMMVLTWLGDKLTQQTIV